MEPQNLQGNPQPQNLPIDPQEQKIRMMRGDLGAPSPQNNPEPKLNIPPQGFGAQAGQVPSAGSGQVPVKPLFDAEEPVFTPNTIAPPPNARVFQTAPVMPTMPTRPPVPVSPPPTSIPVETGATSIDTLIAQGQSKNKAKAMIGGIVALIILAAAAYFIAPLFMKSGDTTNPVAQQPGGDVIPVEPTQPIQPAEPAIPSLFTTAPVKRVNVLLPTPITAAVINNVLKEQATIAGSTEVLLTKEGNLPFTSSELIGVLAPSLKIQTEKIFSGEVSSYVYSDETGAWPGYVAKITDVATAEEIKAWFSALEKTTSRANFFINPPGVLQPFKNGLVNNYPNRYAPGTTAGASFSYLILPEKKLIVVSTSFAGLKDALRLLGL